MPHFLTVQFHGKRCKEYDAPEPFFKVDDLEAGRTLLTLFREDFGAEPPKEPRLVFDLVAADGLALAQAVRFKASVRQVRETWEQAYCVTDGPRFPAGRSGDLAWLYDRADKWQAEIPGQTGSLSGPSKNGDTDPAADIAESKSIAQRVWSFIKAAYGFTVEKVAKGTTDSITKRP